MSESREASRAAGRMRARLADALWGCLEARRLTRSRWATSSRRPA